jgi:hypothetical protein
MVAVQNRDKLERMRKMGRLLLHESAQYRTWALLAASRSHLFPAVVTAASWCDRLAGRSPHRFCRLSGRNDLAATTLTLNLLRPSFLRRIAGADLSLQFYRPAPFVMKGLKKTLVNTRCCSTAIRASDMSHRASADLSLRSRPHQKQRKLKPQLLQRQPRPHPLQIPQNLCRNRRRR